MKKFLLKLNKIRFILLMGTISILPMILVGLMGKNILFENIRAERIKTLGHVADAKHDQLAMLVKRANSRAMVLLSNLNARCNLTQFNEACSINILNIYLSSEEAIGATLYGKRSGKSVMVGDSVVGYNEIVSFQTAQYAKVFGKSGDAKRSYFISTTDPFSGYQLSITYPISNLQAIFDRPPDTGSMGETFLADAEGYFVTEARYHSDQGHNQSIHARPMQSCLRGENKEVLDLDYRDRPVIHGYRFIPEFGAACIMAHADQEEAFAELATFEKKVNVISLISIASIIALSVYITRRFLRIAKLQQQDEEKYRVIFESAKDCILIFDKVGLIIDINPVGHLQLGYTKEEMIGKHITNFVTRESAERSPENMAKLFRDRQIMFESAIIRKNGDVMPVEINAHMIVLNDQEVVFSLHRDITERKQMEFILSESEAKYRSVIETSSDGFWIVDLGGYLLEVNDAYIKRSGYSRKELLSLRMWDLSAHEDIERTYAHIQRIFRDGHERYESVQKAKDGSNWPVEIVASYSDIDDGVIFIFIHDITDRKSVLQKLEDNESKFRFLFENANDGMHVLDVNGIILDINHIGHTRLGYAKEEMIGKSIKNFVIQKISDEMLELTEKLISQKNLTFESAHVCKDGSILPMEINAQVIEQNGQQFFFSINRDITLRKEIENMLSQRLAKYQAVIETSNDGFWIVDMQGNFLEVNDAYVQCSGYSREELLTMSVPDLEHVETAEDTAAHIEKVVREGHDRFESYHKMKDGQICPVEISANYWNIEDGRLFVFIHDITERKKIMKELKESEEKFRIIFENANDGVVMLDMQGHILDLNPKTHLQLGYTKEEMLGKRISEFVIPEFNQGVPERLSKIQSEGYAIFESAHLCKDKTVIPMEVNARMIEKDGKQMIFSINRDITERKKIEREMQTREALSRAVIERILDS